MKKLNSLVFLFAIIGLFYASSCKKSSPSPGPQDLIKQNWKVSTVYSKAGTDSIPLYSSSGSSNKADYSKYRLKFDGTNYTLVDQSNVTTMGTYTFGTGNKTIIFKDGALNGAVYNIVSIDGSKFVFSYPYNDGKNLADLVFHCCACIKI